MAVSIAIFGLLVAIATFLSICLFLGKDLDMAPLISILTCLAVAATFAYICLFVEGSPAWRY